MAIALAPQRAHAYAWMIGHGYAGCATCHLDPSGAGLLNEFGREEAADTLRFHYGSDPAPVEPFFGLWKNPDWLLTGGSFRDGLFFMKVATAPYSQQNILMQADLRMGIDAGRWRAAASLGKLQIATSRAVAIMVAGAVPEARVTGLRQAKSGELALGSCRSLRAEIDGCDALLVGPGMMDGRAAAELIRACMRRPQPPALIVDAAALQAFQGRKPLAPGGPLVPVLTPHAGEMATLWGTKKESVLVAPLQIARQAAARLRAIVVLKGAQTFIAAPDGAAYHNDAGNDGLGVSGSGDTLSGIIAGLSARGADPLRAALWGVYLHARAGDALARRCGQDGYLARQLPGEVPPLLASLS